MRARSTAVVLLLPLALLALVACGDGPDAPPGSSGPTLLPPSSSPGATGQGDPGASASGSDAQPDASHAEVVYVLLQDVEGGTGFCTGTLVSKDVVVTAAHCLDPEVFTAFEIVAPLAAGKPRVSASRPAAFEGDYQDPKSPDLGILRLDEPIELPVYAKLTDVSARVEAGAALTGVAVVRTEEEAEAPLRTSRGFPITSTVSLGYAHGFATPMFSQGGDSGAGLFLVENGKRTHKLVGVARQPEPERDLDHFTRIDPVIEQWLDANARGDE